MLAYASALRRRGREDPSRAFDLGLGTHVARANQGYPSGRCHPVAPCALLPGATIGAGAPIGAHAPLNPRASLDLDEEPHVPPIGHDAAASDRPPIGDPASILKVLVSVPAAFGTSERQR